MAVNEAVRDLLQSSTSDSLDVLHESAQREGLELGRTTIARALRGELARPKAETVDSLAELFGVDVRLLRQAVGRQGGELEPWVPDPRSASLTKDQREALDRLIVAIVTGGQLDAGQAEAQKRPSDGGASVTPPARGDYTLTARQPRHATPTKNQPDPQQQAGEESQVNDDEEYIP